MRPLSLSGISSDEIEFLAADRAAAGGAAGFHIVLLDRELNRLLRSRWIPGEDLAIDFVDLKEELPDDVSGASMAGHKIVFTDDEERVFGINLNTGWTGQIWKFSGSVVLSPCGNWLVAATDRGLLKKIFWSLDPQAPLAVDDVQPLLIKDLDVSDALVIPGEAHDRFRIAIGCYGSVEIVSIVNADRHSPEPMSATARSVTAEGLPFDPVHLNDHSVIAPPLFGDMLYAVDEGCSNLIAVDTRTDTVIPFLAAVPDYGNIQRAVASVDSTACLVTMQNDDTFHWVPGREQLADFSCFEQVLLWSHNRALVPDLDGATIREVKVENR